MIEEEKSPSEEPSSASEEATPEAREERESDQDAPVFLDSAPDALVKGGTRTLASKELFDRRFADAEKRRDQLARDRMDAEGQRKVVDTTGEVLESPILMPGRGGGVMYENRFTSHPEVEQGYIHLVYLDPNGEPNGLECCADLIQAVNEQGMPDLLLILVCPQCTADSDKHQQDNQIRIFQSNKYFDFKPSILLEWFNFQEWAKNMFTGEYELVTRRYRRAGRIIESEPFSCPDCTFRARIVNDRLRPDR